MGHKARAPCRRVDDSVRHSNRARLIDSETDNAQFINADSAAILIV